MHRFEAAAWEWQGDAPWVFVTLPHDLADEIEATAPSGTGFGSIPVEVRVGSSTWETSLFPDKAAASYVLPLKKAIRRAEAIEIGDTVTVGLRLRTS